MHEDEWVLLLRMDTVWLVWVWIWVWIWVWDGYGLWTVIEWIRDVVWVVGKGKGASAGTAHYGGGWQYGMVWYGTGLDWTVPSSVRISIVVSSVSSIQNPVLVSSI